MARHAHPQRRAEETISVYPIDEPIDDSIDDFDRAQRVADRDLGTTEGDATMTIMRVSLAGATWTEPQKAEMATRLIDAFSLIEVGRVAPEARTGFLVQFESLGQTDLYMGDRPMADATPSGKAIVVSAHVMAGPWNDEMKRDLFSEIEAVVRDVADMPRESGAMNFWMTIVEVPEGAWGVDGRPVLISQLAPVFAGEQKDRIARHLAALDP